MIDADTYIANLTAANLNNGERRPEYFKLYNHKIDLEMDNLFPDDFDKLARRLAVDDVLYDKFFRYFNSDSYGDDYDRRKVICYLVSTNFIDNLNCKEMIK